MADKRYRVAYKVNFNDSETFHQQGPGLVKINRGRKTWTVSVVVSARTGNIHFRRKRHRVREAGLIIKTFHLASAVLY